MSTDRSVAEVRRHLPAPPEAVFGAFADANLVSRWLSPSPDVALTVLQLDFRLGGVYRFAYDVPGGHTMFVNGIYQAIEPPSRIVFTWNVEPPDAHAGLQSRVTVIIRADGDGAALCIRHEQLTLPGARERHAQGWLGAVNRLAAWLAPSEAFVRTPPRTSGTRKARKDTSR